MSSRFINHTDSIYIILVKTFRFLISTLRYVHNCINSQCHCYKSWNENFIFQQKQRIKQKSWNLCNKKDFQKLKFQTLFWIFSCQMMMIFKITLTTKWIQLRTLDRRNKFTTVNIINCVKLNTLVIIITCAFQMARFKVPRYVKFVEEFPLTATGKVQKFKLKEEAMRDLNLID